MKYVLTSELNYLLNKVDYKNTITEKKLIALLNIDKKEMKQSLETLVNHGYIEIKILNQDTKLVIVKGGRK